MGKLWNRALRSPAFCEEAFRSQRVAWNIGCGGSRELCKQLAFLRLQRRPPELRGQLFVDKPVVARSFHLELLGGARSAFV